MPKTGRSPVPRRPVVGVVCDTRPTDRHTYHSASETYLAALTGFADVLPLLIPAPRTPLEIGDVLAAVDGLFLSGSPSNVEPSHYGGTPPPESMLLDPARDASALPLIQAAAEVKLPVFAVCRGFQELNVAFGGSLHQFLHEAPDEPGFEPRYDHREDRSAPMEEQFGPAHEAAFVQGGRLRAITGLARANVNSLHGQGVERLGRGLVIEARAPDGTVEAVSLPGEDRFVIGVQWHPEWKPEENPHNAALYRTFGAATRGRRQSQIASD